MANATIQTSFAGGELSPSLYARVDLAKFEVGAALMRNFYADYRGGASNRCGTRFIADLSAQSGPYRLLPFIVSTEASYVLVFSNTSVTIWREGTLVTTVTTPYLAADLALLKYAQSADVMTLVHPSYAPANLTRTSDTTFTYAAIVIGPEVQPPTITDMRAPHSGPYNYGYLVTAVDLDGKEESVPSNIGVKHSEGQDELNNRVVGFEWTAPSTPVSRYNVFKWGPIDAVTMVPATAWGFIGTAQTVTFTDNNIAPDYAKQPPVWGDPFSGGQIESITVTAGGSGYDGVTGDWPAIPYVPLAFTGDGTGAAGYAVIDNANGVIVGAFITNPGKNYTTISATANGEGGTGATFAITLSDITPLYPSCVSYLQQRRTFAGSDEKPATFVMSQPGLFDNFNTTPVSLATDAIAATISSLQVNTIKSLVPVSYGLLAFTSGGCHLIGSSDGPTGAISPETISVTQQASPGANDLVPQLINYDVLFGQNQGNRILRAGFAWERQSFTTSDITQLAPHLFDTYSTVDWCYASEPNKLLWLVRDDGRLLTCTYVPEQDVYAWCRHDSQGLFKAICTVPEGDVDAVYVVVQRHVDNVGEPCWVNYLERFEERGKCCIFDAWFVDSAVELHNCAGEGLIYIEGDTETVGAEVTIYSYDPCGTPNDGFAVDCQTNVEIIYDADAGPINFVLPTPVEGATDAWGVDAELNQYTAFTTEPICGADVTGAVGWQLSEGQIGDLFEAAGASAFTPITGCTAIYPTPDGTKLIFITYGDDGSPGFVANFYVGVAPIPAQGNDPILTNYLRMPARVPSSGTIYVPKSLWVQSFEEEVPDDRPLVLLTQDFGTSHIQWWALPSVNEIVNGTYRGTHPGCSGTLDPDQGPGLALSWTSSDAVNMGESNILVQGGELASNPCGFYFEGFWYMAMPRAWMASGASGIRANYGGTYPTGAAFRKSANPGIYADNAWPGTDVLEVNTTATSATDITATDFLDEDGNPTIPWSDEYTRILDGGANDGWLASYTGRPFMVREGEKTYIYFVIVDANPTYAASIGAGERVVYARVRGYEMVGGTWTQYDTAEGIVLRNGDLAYSGWEFDHIQAAPVFVYEANIYFQMPFYNASDPLSESRSLLTQFGSLSSSIEVDDVVFVPEFCGKVQVTEVVSATQLTAEVVEPFGAVLPDDPDGTIQPIEVWYVTTPTLTIPGLDHLEGKTVWGLADGEVVGPLTVSGGEVTLATPVTTAVIGLRYTAQLKTLYLTQEGIQPGTEQSKRKLLQGVNLRVDCTKGLKVGVDFDNLVTLPELEDDELYSGDAYVPVIPDWNTRGEVCVQQDDPLPANVLGVIVGVVAGDTGR